MDDCCGGRGVSTTSSFSRLTRRQGGEGGMTVLFAKTRPFFFVCIPRVPCTWHNRHDTRVQRCHYSRTMGQAASTYVRRRRRRRLGFEIPLLPRISRSRINFLDLSKFRISIRSLVFSLRFARPSSIVRMAILVRTIFISVRFFFKYRGRFLSRLRMIL